MRLKLQLATTDDAEAIAALRNAISDDLTFRHGRGAWTSYCTTADVLSDLRQAQLYVALHRGEAVATLKLGATNPWPIDPNQFGPARKPLFLTALGIAPDVQRQGHGRACLAAAVKVARRAKADVIYLDTHDHPAAGAGGFLAKCGCRELARRAERPGPRIYFELRLNKSK
jgi:GNAT superfamily N-acetyltransferase